MLLSKVTTGKIKKPHLVLIYGPDNVGKTTFGASAPSPLIIGPEDGSNNINTSRLKVKSFQEIMQTVAELQKEKHDYKTVVLDSLDWIEPLVWKFVCESAGGSVKNIEDFGYGKGYVLALQQWSNLINALKTLREEKQMNVIAVAHSQIKPFNDPSQPSAYDRYSLKLNDKASALWREFVDVVLFATFEVFTKKDGMRTKAFGDGARVLYTERRPGFDAKNRYGLPFQLPLSWEEYERATDIGRTDDIVAIRESIVGIMAEVKDTELKTKITEAVQKAGDNFVQLEAIKQRVLVRLEATN